MESLSSNTDSGTKKPCGACRERKRRCDSGCVFADVIPYNEPHKYRALKEMYNIKWVEDKLRRFSQPLNPTYVVEELFAKDSLLNDKLTSFEPSEFKTGDGNTKRPRSQPCGACKEKKHKCNPRSCVFVGAIPNEEPQKYRTLKEVFNITRLEEILHPLNHDQRVEVVSLFLSEADILIKELSQESRNHLAPYLHSPLNHLGMRVLLLIQICTVYEEI